MATDAPRALLTRHEIGKSPAMVVLGLPLVIDSWHIDQCQF